MKLSISLVAVKKITSVVSRSNFNNDKIEQAAKTILEAEGVINPIVLQRTPSESYQVVAGDFEYYAAARAREIDPRKGEMIGAFVIEDEKEAAIKKQIELFRKFPIESSEIPKIPSSNPDSENRLLSLETRLTNIESRFEARIIEMQAGHKQEISKLENQFKEVQKRLPEPIEPLKALNTLSLPVLASRLNRIKPKKEVIENIVNEREKNGQFKSFADVVERVKGCGDKTMLKIIDVFSEN